MISKMILTRPFPRFLFFTGLLLLAAACSSGQPAQDPSAPITTQAAPPAPGITAAPVDTHEPVLTESPAAIPTATGTNPAAPTRTVSETGGTVETLPPATPPFDPASWQELPIVPEVSPRVREIYQRGLELGNNPLSFSKIGDCGSTPAWFLGDFDRGPQYYRLGEFTYLEEVIQAFQGSWDRTSLAAKSGFNASSVLTPLWADRSQCEANETPLACEYRVHRPTFAFIMLGTNDVWHPDRFEPQMREIIEFSIEQGVIPILSTKADNVEGDGSINATIARLAYEYEIPLWNFWRAVQHLPDGGLQEDGAHLTWAGNRFDDPEAMKKAWPVRNLTALQVLDAVWRSASAP